MDNRTALVFACLIIGIFAADIFFFHWGLGTILGKQLAATSEWLAFWR